MRKNSSFSIFIYIFIYVFSFLITGCDNSIVSYEYDKYYPSDEEVNQSEESDDTDVDYYLNISADSLSLDSNGFYVMEYLDGYYQTFTTLTAETGSMSTYQHIAWMSNKEIKIGNDWINLVNGYSYTDEFGEAHTVLSIWSEFVADTIKVYAGYNDEYNNHYIDSLDVIIKNEE